MVIGVFPGRDTGSVIAGFTVHVEIAFFGNAPVVIIFSCFTGISLTTVAWTFLGVEGTGLRAVSQGIIRISGDGIAFLGFNELPVGSIIPGFQLMMILVVSMTDTGIQVIVYPAEAIIRINLDFTLE